MSKANKLDYLRGKQLNPADDLRTILSGLEELEPSLKSLDRHKALNMLHKLDRAQILFNQLDELQVDLISERGRFTSFQATIRKRAGVVLKSLGGPSALAEDRPIPPPARERWWWYIHEDVAAKQRQTLRTILFVAVFILLALGGAYLAFQTILAPSPEAVARFEAESDSIDAFEQGEYQLAIDEVGQGLAVVPDDPGLLILDGIYREILEQPEAEISFERALAQVDTPTTFYLGRGQIYFRTSQYEKSERDARTALEIDTGSANAWLLLGQSLEFQGKRFEAIPAYEQAGELALANGNDQLVVMARLALGRVMGQMP